MVAGLVVAGLVLNLFSGASSELGLPLSLDRPVLLTALVLLLAAKRPQWDATPLVAVMSLTVLWTLWSWAATGSLSETDKAFALVDRVAIPFAMFLIGPAVFDTPNRRDLLLKMLSLVGIYLGLTALFQFLGMFQFVYPTYARDLVNGRATGPFLHYEPLGMACVITAVAGAVLAGRRQGPWRVVGVTSLLASPVGVVLCLTRSTWLSAVLAVVLVPLVVPRLRRWLPAVWLFVAGVAALVAYQLPSFVDSLEDRLRTEGPLNDRVLTNDAAVRIVESRPLDGVGWLRFPEVYTEWVVQSDTLPMATTNIEVHNVFLARAAETGILGAVFWGLAVLMGPVAAMVRRPRTPEMLGWRLLTLGAFLAWLVPTLFSPNPYTFPNFLFWLIAGITAGPLVVRRTSRGTPPGPARGD